MSDDNGTRRRRAPDGLRARGKRFWSQTLDVYELTDSETELLAEACRTLDALDLLAASVARDGAMVTGSQGQPVVNPALTEARGQRVTLHRLLAALELPDEDGESVPTVTSMRAKRAASVRWEGHRPDTGRVGVSGGL